MNEIIEQDLYRYGGAKGFYAFIKTFFLTPGFRFTYFWRKCQISGNIFYRIIYRHYFIKYGIQIPRQTCVGKGFYIGHFGGIIVNEMAVIGENCNLSPNVTIGQVNRGIKKGSPILGNNVWIGTGSVIVGQITIGDNVLIAPNSFVNFDVPSNSLVIQGKIKKRENATEGYINYRV